MPSGGGLAFEPVLHPGPRFWKIPPNKQTWLNLHLWWHQGHNRLCVVIRLQYHKAHGRTAATTTTTTEGTRTQNQTETG